ncbi:MAG TPA: anthranilate phosphoribosyltransferase, partial [Paracoccaceae bacterium]|nr:anthranilate phosphoribosyltransferase [Paracoccaceae bacterium]
SICGRTQAVTLADGKIEAREVHPEEAGLPVHPLDAILGGTPEANAAAFRALLGGAHGAYRDAVVLNSAAALLIAGRASDLRAGAEMARESLDSGAARGKVDALARATNEEC